MNFHRRTFAVLLTACAVVLGSCSSSSDSQVLAPSDSVAQSVPGATEDTVLVAVEGASECATALAAFSAVSNILMSGLAKPSSFEADRYADNLELTSGVIAPEIADDYAVFATGYGTAGEALATVRKVGAGSSKGAAAIDQAAAILNDASVTQAAQSVAAFLANDCSVNK